ncbi:hypothetical protein, conserved [Eimeria tenella]|uniref:Serine aminopeptidase S33 domain-containing protein n=1 Tax=Eimeria tenella TaxID=5802 RepID=U6L8P9_EIMTE|nr:hypothetical protein, conserved [Eimeria tenella]CDJ45578.1 hypothetical protein, conserved [Eimeria tenella]|eukprot:XP_013236324.1 hypothetical protein, conserved [Eimeria tenella]
MFLIGLSLGGWVALRAVQLAAAERRNRAAAAAAAADPTAAAAAAADFTYSHVFQDNQSYMECCTTPEAAAAAAATDADSAAAAGAAAAAAEAPLGLRGLVLLSPMLQLSRRRYLQRSRLLQFAAAAFAAVRPHAAVVPPRKSRRRHPHLHAYYSSDPLTYKEGVPAGIAVPLLWEMEAATTPQELLLLQQQDAAAVLMLHTVHDPLCDISGPVSCFSELAGIRDRQLLAIEGPPLPAAAAGAQQQQQQQDASSSSGDPQQHVHPKLRKLHPYFHQHLPDPPSPQPHQPQQQQRQQQQQQEVAASVEEIERRMQQLSQTGEQQPKVFIAKGVDVLHDLPNEPGQQHLFRLLATWITCRCP